jgi:hypothetical protein
MNVRDSMRRPLLAAVLALAALAPPAGGQARLPPPALDPASVPSAAAGALHGTVTDASTGRPVAGATVRVRELGRRDVSHADGSFHFDALPPGGYTLAAERIGYAPGKRSVRVANEGVAVIDSHEANDSDYDSPAIPITVTP